jgi:hypothetical protein
MEPKSPKPAQAQSDREARLKAALKANMARRKAQTRARSGQAEDKPDRNGPNEESR